MIRNLPNYPEKAAAMAKEKRENLPKLAKWRRRLRWLAATSVILIGILFIAMQITSPLMSKNHQRIEAWVSRELGHDVRFAQIKLEWSIVTPVVVLRDFEVKADNQQENWLQVSRMQFAIDWWQSLVKQELRLGKWKVKGVDVAVANITPKQQNADLSQLFISLDRWIGKNPVYVKALTMHLFDPNQQAMDIVFDELQLHKQRGKVSSIEKPVLRAWLQEKEIVDKKQLHQRLSIRGRAHLEDSPQQKVDFIFETEPYINNKTLPDAKLFVNLQHFSLDLIPSSLLPGQALLQGNQVSGKMWVDIQAGNIAALQTVFELSRIKNDNQSYQPLTVNGHIYALKDTEKGWWVTADKLQMKTSHHKPIAGKFALQYRDVKAADMDWLVRVPQFSFSQGTAQLSGMLQWHQPSRISHDKQEQAYVKFQASAKEFPIQQILNILPRQIMYPKLYNWLQDAPKAGVLKNVDIDIDGGVNDIVLGKAPAKIHGQGEISDLKLKYHPSWPSLQAKSSTLSLLQDTLKITSHNAATQNTEVNKLQVSIKSLFNPGKAKLHVDANTQADLGKLIHFIHQSPLQHNVGQRLAPLRLAGSAALHVVVAMPLNAQHMLEQLKVDGQLSFNKAGLQLKQWPITIDQLQGDIQFNEKNILTKQLQGKLWGEVFNFSFVNENREGRKVTNITAHTRLALPALAKDFTVVNALPMLGSAQADINIIVPDDTQLPIRLKVTSYLQGIHIALPPPFGKTTSEIKPSQVTANLDPKLGNTFKVNYDEGKVLMDVSHITNMATTWKMRFNSPAVIGEAKLSLLPQSHRLTGQFEKIHLTTQTDQPASQQTLDPLVVPSLNIQVNHFQLDQKLLGKLILTTQKTNDGHDITKLQTQSRALTINATGKWTHQRGIQSTALDGVMTTKEFKNALRALHITPSLESDESRIEFSLNWPGAPYQFAMAKLNGSAYFKLKDGRVPNISKQTSQLIGIGRMINMLSLSSIPKRLRLDFSDLTETGLHFDKFSGKVLILNGDANTRDATLDGAVTRIRWRGRVGLAKQDYDLLMRVEPHMTSSLPVVAAIAGGPVVGPVAGVATWMMNKAIAPDIERLNSYTYEITGSWKQPRIIPIDPSRLSPRAPVEDRSE